MKITINGKISEEALKSILATQKEKTEIIADFCKSKKIETLAYKDSELEFEYLTDNKPEKPKQKKIEVRTDVERN